MIVDGAWRNGEPGILFYDTMNDSPYKYSNQEIMATNPCGEQPLPFNGACNLGSLDISKFLDEDKTINLELFELAIELSVNFLDHVISESAYPTKDIETWVKDNRPVGLGIMGLADYYLMRKIAYGSDKALEELRFILNFMAITAENKSIELGELYGIPKACKKLPIRRRNITVLSIAPTGTISLIAGCNSGIEPIFSEITIRNDKTGSYEFNNISSDADYFRCAVSINGAKEVTWEEHVNTQSNAQMFIDSGVSKTINFPTNTHRETIYKAFMLAWKSKCKGLTVYRNHSRNIEVLSPKNLKKDLCPICESELLHIDGCKKCSNPDCSFSLCDV
jgi:ribonucleoside-diphosphate reductase alpha chain